MMKLVPIDKVNPSTYNPRVADPKRLDIIELSLRKLGFVLPIFADANGEILSGHQRHHVAQRMKMTHVPVFYTKAMGLDKRKALNIAFNRGTNDMAAVDTPTSMTEALGKADIFALAAAIPDADDLTPCMGAKSVPVASLLEKNAGRWVKYARNVARTLAKHDITMPIVCTPDNVVVNGIGRLEYAAVKGLESVEVVYVTPAQRDFTYAMLNYLTMDFNIHERYEDLLRYNSFRRTRGHRDYLGRCFTFKLLGSESSVNFDVTKPKNTYLWRKTFGKTVLDFGAGLYCETDILRSVGIDCVPFEPYRLDGESINRQKSIDSIAGDFIKRVGEGVQFDSIFLSAIMNSVPFLQDRLHILAIIAALCSEKTKVYAVSASTKQAGYRTTSGAEFLNEADSARLQFRLDYEPRITIADFSATPKVQKYHTPQEWYDLWKLRFEHVSVTESANNVECICSGAKPVSLSDLHAALEFEFNLPYPDGHRMGLVDEIKKAFAMRTEAVKLTAL